MYYVFTRAESRCKNVLLTRALCCSTFDKKRAIRFSSEGSQSGSGFGQSVFKHEISISIV